MEKFAFFLIALALSASGCGTKPAVTGVRTSGHTTAALQVMTGSAAAPDDASVIPPDSDASSDSINPMLTVPAQTEPGVDYYLSGVDRESMNELHSIGGSFDHGSMRILATFSPPGYRDSSREYRSLYVVESQGYPRVLSRVFGPLGNPTRNGIVLTSIRDGALFAADAAQRVLAGQLVPGQNKFLLSLGEGQGAATRTVLIAFTPGTDRYEILYDTLGAHSISSYNRYRENYFDASATQRSTSIGSNPFGIRENLGTFQSDYSPVSLDGIPDAANACTTWKARVSTEWEAFQTRKLRTVLNDADAWIAQLQTTLQTTQAERERAGVWNSFMTEISRSTSDVDLIRRIWNTRPRFLATIPQTSRRILTPAINPVWSNAGPVIEFCVRGTVTETRPRTGWVYNVARCLTWTPAISQHGIVTRFEQSRPAIWERPDVSVAARGSAFFREMMAERWDFFHGIFEDFPIGLRGECLRQAP